MCFVIYTNAFISYSLKIFPVADGEAKSTASSRSTAAERTGRYKSLLTDYFALPRHPYLNEVNWINARAGILSEFEKILHNVPNTTMEIQDFHTSISFVPNIATEIKGKNIIVTFAGRNRGKAGDEILVIGAHYDSDASVLISIDDNGSGVVAMLEIARGLADAIVNRKAVLVNTIMFVAFDIQNVSKQSYLTLRKKKRDKCLNYLFILTGV